MNFGGAQGGLKKMLNGKVLLEGVIEQRPTNKKRRLIKADFSKISSIFQKSCSFLIFVSRIAPHFAKWLSKQLHTLQNG